MKNISTTDYHGDERSSIGHAAILAAPLWASGLVFLAVLFAITKHGQFFSLQFLAMAVVIVLGSTVAALRVMDRDLQRAALQNSPTYRSLKLRSKRLHGARLV